MPYSVADKINYALPTDKYFVEAMKLPKSPVQESEPEEGWLDTLDNCVTTATYVIGGIGIAAAAGYGLYVAGASVGAKEVADFCEKRVTDLLQNRIDIGGTSPSFFERMYNVGTTFIGRLGDGTKTAFVLYVAKDYIPTLIWGALATATTFTVSSSTSNEKKESSWQWTATKVIGTMGLLAVAGYGMYCAGMNAGAGKATEICEAGIAALKNSGVLVISSGELSLEGPVSNALTLSQGSALSLQFTGTISDHIYETAMKNLPLPDPSVLWESAKEYATEKYDNFALTVKVVGGVIVTPYILPPIVAAAKFGARFVRFIAHRR